MPHCLLCDASIQPFFDFGEMPMGNGFLTADQFDEEYFFHLQIAFCPKCLMVQLTEQVDREQMFHEQYAYFSSTSTRMVEHFRRFSEFVTANALSGKDPFVVEIGSNDGIMLQNFAKAGIRHLGLEPSANVARAAMDRGIQTICDFFEEETAERIVAEFGEADAIIAANVMCHIPYLHSVLRGVKTLLKPDGFFIFEDPYLGDILEKTAYDQIYDEHTFYFSASSIGRLAERHEMELVDLWPQPVHGGSMRYVLAHQESRERSERVTAQLERENGPLQLGKVSTYEQFGRNINKSRDDLLALLQECRDQEKRVVGYGATSKSTTVINYCGITDDLIEFISDTTPIKQGKYSPGAHVLVRAYDEFAAQYPDYALLFAWNHSTEIMQKEQKFRDAGGKWIVYVPEVRVLS